MSCSPFLSLFLSLDRFLNVSLYSCDLFTAALSGEALHKSISNVSGGTYTLYTGHVAVLVLHQYHHRLKALICDIKEYTFGLGKIHRVWVAKLLTQPFVCVCAHICHTVLTSMHFILKPSKILLLRYKIHYLIFALIDIVIF